MAERSPLISMALLFAPTVCVVALRFGLPNIEELLIEDIIAQVVIHSLAIILGIIMYLKYRVVEDHEYHRSSAIKGLSKMYKMEDKGLWGRGDDLQMENDGTPKEWFDNRGRRTINLD